MAFGSPSASQARVNSVPVGTRYWKWLFIVCVPRGSSTIRCLLYNRWTGCIDNSITMLMLLPSTYLVLKTHWMSELSAFHSVSVIHHKVVDLQQVAACNVSYSQASDWTGKTEHADQENMPICGPQTGIRFIRTVQQPGHLCLATFKLVTVVLCHWIENTVVMVYTTSTLKLTLTRCSIGIQQVQYDKQQETARHHFLTFWACTLERYLYVT